MSPGKVERSQTSRQDQDLKLLSIDCSNLSYIESDTLKLAIQGNFGHGKDTECLGKGMGSLWVGSIKPSIYRTRISISLFYLVLLLLPITFLANKWFLSIVLKFNWVFNWVISLLTRINFIKKLLSIFIMLIEFRGCDRKCQNYYQLIRFYLKW